MSNANLYLDNPLESSNPQVVKCGDTDARSALFLTKEHQVQIGQTANSDSLALQIFGLVSIQTLPKAPGSLQTVGVVVDPKTGQLYQKG